MYAEGDQRKTDGVEKNKERSKTIKGKLSEITKDKQLNRRKRNQVVRKRRRKLREK